MYVPAFGVSVIAYNLNRDRHKSHGVWRMTDVGARDGNDHPAGPNLVKRFAGWAPLGVPRRESDIDHAVEQLYEVYFAHTDDKITAMDRLITQNERIVSRSGMIMSFSGIMVGILLFVANKPQIFSHAYQEIGFYFAVAVWAVCTLRLLWSLRHHLPPPWEYNTAIDFKMTAKLYLRRMSLYNELLVAAAFCFAVTLAMIIPMTASYVDLIFHSKP